MFSFLALISVLTNFAFADPIEGRWKTIDDETGNPKSIVNVWIEDGKLKGKIVQLIRQPDEEPDPICDVCVGDRKDKKINGMEIVWGLEGENGVWTDGYILDPGNGKTYGCNMKVLEDGRLEVRGFIGFSLIGRTQYWQRVE